MGGGTSKGRKKTHDKGLFHRLKTKIEIITTKYLEFVFQTMATSSVMQIHYDLSKLGVARGSHLNVSIKIRDAQATAVDNVEKGSCYGSI